jgi:hypothetical protein
VEPNPSGAKIRDVVHAAARREMVGDDILTARLGGKAIVSFFLNGKTNILIANRIQISSYKGYSEDRK